MLKLPTTRISLAAASEVSRDGCFTHLSGYGEDLNSLSEIISWSKDNMLIKEVLMTPINH